MMGGAKRRPSGGCQSAAPDGAARSVRAIAALSGGALARRPTSTRSWAALRSSRLLFNQLIRPHEHGPRDREVERLRRLEVDHQLEFGRLLDGKLGGPDALEDLDDVAGSAAEEIDVVGPVTHQAAGFHPIRVGVNRRQPMPRSEEHTSEL